MLLIHCENETNYLLAAIRIITLMITPGAVHLDVCGFGGAAAVCRRGDERRFTCCAGLVLVGPCASASDGDAQNFSPAGMSHTELHLVALCSTPAHRALRADAAGQHGEFRRPSRLPPPPGAAYAPGVPCHAVLSGGGRMQVYKRIPRAFALCFARFARCLSSCGVVLTSTIGTAVPIKCHGAKFARLGRGFPHLAPHRRLI